MPTSASIYTSHRRRRLGIVSAMALGWALMLVFSPALIVVALVADLVTAPRRLATVRTVTFGFCYLSLELAGVGRAVWLWLRIHPHRGPAWIEAHRRLQAWWTGSVFAAAERLVGLKVTVEGAEALDVEPSLVFGRHVSIVDSLVTAYLLGARRGRELRYVLKRELRLDPCLDIVGSRLRNHFVDRQSPDSAAEIAAVGELADDLEPTSAVVVFPEGTRFSPRKRQRALARLEGGDPELARMGEGLRHLLPPRPGGALALLERSSDTDVVLIAHVGFEGLDTIGGLWRAIPFAEPVEVAAWHVPREQVPSGRAEQVRWLFERWVEIDDWIERTRRRRGEIG